MSSSIQWAANLSTSAPNEPPNVSSAPPSSCRVSVVLVVQWRKECRQTEDMEPKIPLVGNTHQWKRLIHDSCGSMALCSAGAGMVRKQTM